MPFPMIRRFPRVTRERGFTLVEMMVAVLAGTVVMGALFAILDLTLRQTSRTITQVDATQRARTAMESIETELHSACVGGDVVGAR